MGIQTSSINSGPVAGFRNRIINGGMVIDQRNNGGGLSSGVNAVTYSVDRWYLYALGAAVTAQRVGSSAAIYQSAIRIIGAAGNSATVIGQRIEVTNSYDLANRSISLSFAAATSNSIPIVWSLYYANTADNFTSRTPIASGTQATTQVLTNYTAPNILLPPQATTGLMLEFVVANFTSGSIDITGVQLEPGPVATPFERRPFGAELALCQRYYCTQIAHAQSPVAGSIITPIYFPVTMRAFPTVTNVSAGTSVNATVNQLAPQNQASALFQIIASSIGGYIVGRVDAYSAEL